jgi:hypothetical protein
LDLNLRPLGPEPRAEDASLQAAFGPANFVGGKCEMAS